MIQDAGTAGATWGLISWNTEGEGEVPPGTGLVVEARAADTQAGLGAEPFVEVASGVPFDLPGRYIQARVTMVAGPGDASPVLSDLRISVVGQDPAVPAMTVGNVEIFESDSTLAEYLPN